MMPGKEKEGMFLFVQDGCPYCVEEKQAINNSPLKDKIKILNLSDDHVIDNPDVRNLVEKLDISGVPQIISIVDNKVCLMERDEKGILRKGKCVMI